jgi:hypothetical protein
MIMRGSAEVIHAWRAVKLSKDDDDDDDGDRNDIGVVKVVNVVAGHS